MVRVALPGSEFAMTLTPGIVGASQLDVGNAQPIFNALVPKEGPKMVPYVLDFPTQSTYLVDLTLTQQQQRISFIQSMFVDASAATANVDVSVTGTQQTIVVPKGDQGYFPILAPTSGAKFSVTSSSTQPVTIIFMNVPLPSDVWGASSAAGSSVAITGPLAPVSTGAGLDPVAVSATAGSSAWADSSATSTTGSFAIFTAQAAGAVNFRQVTAPVANDLWIHRFGGTAGVGLAGCFKIPAGSTYVTQPGESCYQAWNGFTGVAAQTIPAAQQLGN